MRSEKGIGKSKHKNEFGEFPSPESCVLPDTPGNTAAAAASAVAAQLAAVVGHLAAAVEQLG